MLSLRRGNCRPRSDIRGRRSLRSLSAPASALPRSTAAGDGARLAADGVAQHAEAAFNFLVDSTLLRAVTLGMVDAEEFYERTADALAALVHSPRQSDATDRHS